MNKKTRNAVIIGVVVLLAVTAAALMKSNRGGTPMSSSVALFDQCMNSAFDYVEKQSPEYCKCFAENYPALAEQIKEMQGKNADEISRIVEKGSPMDKCEPLRARDFEKEAQVVKQRFVDQCMQLDNWSPAYCECTAAFMAQQSIEAMKAYANTQTQQDDAMLKNSFASASDAQKQCDHLRQATKAAPQHGTPPDTIELPDHYDIKDEKGNVVRLPMPAR